MRQRQTQETIGKAEFAIKNVEAIWLLEAPFEISYADDAGTTIEIVRAHTFRIVGIKGFEDVDWFVAIDPFTDYAQPLYGAGECEFGSFLPGTDRTETKESAAYETIKFAIRVPEEERPAAYERMKAYGRNWRMKR